MDLQAQVGGVATETKVETFKGERSQFIASLTPDDREQIFQIYHRVGGRRVIGKSRGSSPGSSRETRTYHQMSWN